MPISFTVKKSVPAGPGDDDGWYSTFDDDFWVSRTFGEGTDYAVYNASTGWTTNTAGGSTSIQLLPAGIWVEDFEPTSVRLKFSSIDPAGSSGSIVLMNTPGEGFTIGTTAWSSYTSEGEITLDFNAGGETGYVDLGYISIPSLLGGGEYTLTDIQFNSDPGIPEEPAGTVWYDATDNTYWVTGEPSGSMGATWDGSKWTRNGGTPNLWATGSWASGFRPSLCRVTGTVWDQDRPMHIADSGSNWIHEGRTPSAASGEALYTLYGGSWGSDGDIYELQIQGFDTVTKIEFNANPSPA